MTKQETKTLDRARAGGRGSLMRMMAIVTFCLCYPIAAYVFGWPR